MKRRKGGEGGRGGEQRRQRRRGRRGAGGAEGHQKKKEEEADRRAMAVDAAERAQHPSGRGGCLSSLLQLHCGVPRVSVRNCPRRSALPFLYQLLYPFAAWPQKKKRENSKQGNENFISGRISAGCSTGAPNPGREAHPVHFGPVPGSAWSFSSRGGLEASVPVAGLCGLAYTEKASKNRPGGGQ